MPNNGYEWLEETNNQKALPETEFSQKYQEPDRTYDSELKADQDYVSTLPDLQNGPSSLIQGSKVSIQQVGIHNFRLPLKYRRRNSNDFIELETSITGTVSLDSHKKGINMSRIMRSFYEHKDYLFDIDHLEHILDLYKKNLQSFDAKLILKFSYPIMQQSLRSGHEGYQYYKVALEADTDSAGNMRKKMHFDFVYSSACPCSFELSEHARKYRNKAVVPHSQRSVTRISIQFKDFIWIEDLRDLCIEALKTETQVMVKREDEQAFAELNGSNLKFVEDASRLLHEQLIKHPNIIDFKIVCSHQESLHSHDAIGVIIKGVPGGFTDDISPEIYSSLIHKSC